jgi:citrate synthase
VARTRAQRRRHSFWLGVAAVITLLVLLFARDVTRAAHNSLSPRRSENRSFAALASSLIAQENNLDLRLRYLLNNGESLSRAVFAARLTQLSDQLVLWPTESEQLYRPVLAHDVNDILAQEVSTRFADYEVIFTDVVESLHLPPATLPWPTGDMNILNTNAAQSSLLSTSKQWNTRRWSLAHEPGRVVLDATSNGVALSPLSSDIGALRSSSNLAATRGVGIAAVAVTPSPLPAPSGELLLPPVKAVHVGVSVINGNYIEQPIEVEELCLQSITVTDNRTGETREIPSTMAASRRTSSPRPAPGVWFYDPGFIYTAMAESAITYIDGDAGILRYRGYPIEQLAEHSTYLEVAYLLNHGELPNEAAVAAWEQEITYHTYIHENVRKRFLEGFNYDAHPMGMLVSAVAALSTYYKDAKTSTTPRSCTARSSASSPRCPRSPRPAHRFSVGMPFVYPDNNLGYARELPVDDVEGRRAALRARPGAGPRPRRPVHPARRPRAELRHDRDARRRLLPRRPLLGDRRACAALYGPRHGGANEAVLKMLTEIGSIENVPAYVETVKQGKVLLEGFGHRVYKNFDPRAKIIKKIADDVFEVTGKNPLLDIALKLEEVALPTSTSSRVTSTPTSTSTRAHLPGDGLPARDVHGALRHPAHRRGGWRTSRSCSTRT